MYHNYFDGEEEEDKAQNSSNEEEALPVQGVFKGV